MSDAMPKGKPVDFSNSALARYLSALFYLSDGNTDGARIEFEQLQAAFSREMHSLAFFAFMIKLSCT
jgi:hypothetical protein